MIARPTRLAPQFLAPPLALALALALSGCDVFTQLSNIGRAPPLSPIANPTAARSYRPVSMPMPAADDEPESAASLWRRDARGFFKDQRAARIGDIVTVLVSINDGATLKDNTTAGRTSTDAMGIPALAGVTTLLPHLLGKNPSSLVSANGSIANTGSGQIGRSEAVTLSLAGEITQVLPNGNFVVVAHQEMEVNEELRVLSVSGIVRPEDISSDNTIASSQLAEARIAYGGTGTIENMQQPGLGQQLLNVIMPF